MMKTNDVELTTVAFSSVLFFPLIVAPLHCVHLFSTCVQRNVPQVVARKKHILPRKPTAKGPENQWLEDEMSF